VTPHPSSKFLLPCMWGQGGKRIVACFTFSFNVDLEGEKLSYFQGVFGDGSQSGLLDQSIVLTMVIG